MKYLFSLLAVLGFLALSSISTLAQDTNKTVLEQVTTTAKQTVATNLNQVMIEILQGAKAAAGEVYQASKQTIGQAYDFVKKEAPQVIKEFLMWKVASAIIWIAIWGSVGIAVFYFGWLVRNFAHKRNDSDFLAWSWILRIAALVVLIISLGINGMNITEILVAPRVYIIEYVVDALNPPNHSR